MPKLLQRNLWKYLINMAAAIAALTLVSFLLAWFTDRDSNEVTDLLSFPLGFMCVPFVQSIIYNGSGNLFVLDDYFYVAPYSDRLRKALLKKYFRRQFLSGCALGAVWYIFMYCFTAAGACMHPAKVMFGMIVQGCVYYQILFAGYYRPHLLLMVVALVTFLLGGGILTGIMIDPILSLADYIVMAVLGVICAAAVLVLRFKYYEQMIDLNSRYEAGRSAGRGFSK